MKWTDEDKQRAMAMRASHAKLREIAAALPGKRTVFQVANMLRDLAEPKKRNEVMIEIMAGLGTGNVTPPDFVIEQAIMRAVYPRTSTMRLCGDPVLEQCTMHPRHFQKMESRT